MGQICTKDEEVDRIQQDKQQDAPNQFSLKPLGGPNSIHQSNAQDFDQNRPYEQSQPQYPDFQNNHGYPIGGSHIVGAQAGGSQIGDLNNRNQGQLDKPVGGSHIVGAYESQLGGSNIGGSKGDSQFDKNPQNGGSIYASNNQPTPIIEDHPSSKNFEPTKLMNNINPLVQRKLDTLAPLTAQNPKFMELNKSYSNFPQAQTPFKHTTLNWTYQGQMSKGVPNGFGRQINKDGSIYEGYFHDGVPHQYSRHITTDGKIFEGYFNNGLPNGKGTSTSPDGITTESENWNRDGPNGFTTIVAPGRRILFQGNLVQNKKSGKCYWYDDNNHCAEEGNFAGDVLDGEGRRAWDNGRQYVGNFKNGKEEGKGVLTFVDGRRFDGMFVNGKPNGPGTFYTDTGKPMQQTWKDGRRV